MLAEGDDLWMEFGVVPIGLFDSDWAAVGLSSLGACGSEIGSPDPVSALAPFEISDPVGAWPRGASWALNWTVKNSVLQGGVGCATLFLWCRG